MKELPYLDELILEYMEEVARNWNEPTQEARSLANRIQREIGVKLL